MNNDSKALAIYECFLLLKSQRICVAIAIGYSMFTLKAIINKMYPQEVKPFML